MSRRKPCALFWACALGLLPATLHPMWADTPGLADADVQRLREEAVRFINIDRAANGAPPVLLDDRASAMGDLYCTRALELGVRGHYLTDGLSPFLRYGFWMRGTEYTGQNVCSTFGVTGATWTYERILTKIREYQAMMMAETPPNDRHKRNILSPYHTHVGIGLAWGPTGVRMSHEFVNRLVTVQELPEEIPVDSTPVLTGRILDPERYELAGITMFFEEVPVEITIAEADSRVSYGLPEDHRFLRPVLPEGRFYTDTRSRGDIVIDDAGGFSCRLHFWTGRPGIYGVMVRLRDREVATEEQVPATYVCIRVYDPAAVGR